MNKKELENLKNSQDDFEGKMKSFCVPWKAKNVKRTYKKMRKKFRKLSQGKEYFRK